MVRTFCVLRLELWKLIARAMESTVSLPKVSNFAECLAFKAQAMAEFQRAKENLSLALRCYEKAVDHQLQQDLSGVCE